MAASTLLENSWAPSLLSEDSFLTVMLHFGSTGSETLTSLYLESEGLVLNSYPTPVEVFPLTVTFLSAPGFVSRNSFLFMSAGE